MYLWQHKGTSCYFPQKTKPVGRESFMEEYINLDFMEEVEGENHLLSDEVDLMRYYNDYSDYKSRIVANKKDVLGLLWLTKLELR